MPGDISNSSQIGLNQVGSSHGRTTNGGILNVSLNDCSSSGQIIPYPESGPEGIKTPTYSQYPISSGGTGISLNALRGITSKEKFFLIATDNGNGQSTETIQELTIPAGVQYLKFYMIGGGGGGGGTDTYPGGTGGGGDVLVGTCDLSFAGDINLTRKLYIHVGEGGSPGGFGNDWTKIGKGGSGVAFYPTSSGSWSAWTNTWAVYVVGINSLPGNVPIIFSRNVYIPFDGIFTFKYTSDDFLDLYVDGELVSNATGGAASPTPLSFDKFLTKGYHKLKFVLDNSGGNVSCLACLVSYGDTWIWGTRPDQDRTATGGNGGAGYGGSGSGGGGGSASWIEIETSSGLYPIAICSGGGAGGGGGNLGDSIQSKNAGIISNKLVRSNTGSVRPGGVGFSNTGNGGGGGAGGGGYINTLSTATLFGYNFSGASGYTTTLGNDTSGHGGGNGVSWIHTSAGTFSDIRHTTPLLRIPTLVLNKDGTSISTTSFNISNYGVGGLAGQAGSNGLVYIEWGYIAAPSNTLNVQFQNITSEIFPKQKTLTFTASPTSGFSETISGVRCEASGGDIENYTFNWSFVSGVGVVSFSNPTSQQTNITVNTTTFDPGATPTIVRCVVNDGVRTSTSFINITWAYDSGGGGA